MNYYIYRHIRLDKNEVFYIGVGKKRFISENTVYERAFSNRYRNKTWYGIVNKSKIKIEIVLDYLSKDDASNKEKEFIKLYGRIITNNGTLANYDTGGYKNIERSSLEKIVSKYDEFGQLLKTYNSLVECGLDNNISTGRIHDAINKNIKRNNYIFKYGSELTVPPIYKKYKKIQKLDLENNILEEYENVMQASKITNIPNTTIWSYCNNLRKCKEYKWIYKTN